MCKFHINVQINYCSEEWTKPNSQDTSNQSQIQKVIFMAKTNIQFTSEFIISYRTDVVTVCVFLGPICQIFNKKQCIY